MKFQLLFCVCFLTSFLCVATVDLFRPRLEEKVIVAVNDADADADADDDIAKTVLSVMDKSQNPCNDFYLYSCGGWLNSTQLPPDQSRYDRGFSIIDENNKNVLLSIINSIEEDPKHHLEDADYSKLKNLYLSCMNLSALENISYLPLLPYFDRINSLKTLDDMFYLIGFFYSQGLSDLFFNFYVTLDSKNPLLYIGGFGQGGLTLPYEQLYLSDDDSTVAIRQKYLQHIQNMFVLVGVPQSNAKQYSLKILDLETQIAKFTVPSDQLVDPFKTYNKLNIDGLQKISPDLPWNSFVTGLGRSFTQATVDVPEFYSNLSVLLSSTDFEELTVYLKWQVITTYANRLSSPFRDEYFDFFARTLQGQKEPAPRSKTCLRAVDAALGELLGVPFLERAFPGESRHQAESILLGIETAMRQDLTSLDWMDDITRGRALEKLMKVQNMIGGPTNPKNYSNVVIEPNSYFYNLARAEREDARERFDQIETPVDKSEWFMTPATVNAYYDPTRNQMVFPAGIMQQPFFNTSFPSSMNIGGIGMVMGHELTHGFDNQGRDFDGDGVLENWWQNDTSEKFDQKVKCVIDQYSKFEIIKGVFVNGQLTQGENIADMGGIKNAFGFYKNLIGPDGNKPSFVDGLTNFQLFFVAFGQTWCEKATDEYYRVQVQTDPHSPAKFRVLGPLINLPDFSDTFRCPVGSVMNPEKHCAVW